MSRYIDADELWKEIESVEYYGRDAEVSRICGLIQSAPTAEVKPIFYGEWVNINGIKTCNQCGAGNASAYDSFCPNCGAFMKKKSEEEE